MSVEINNIKIDQFVAAYLETEKSIVPDAEDDPRLMLDIQENLEHLILLTAELNEGWGDFFDDMDEHQAAMYIIKLSPALRASEQIMELIKRYDLDRGDIKTFYKSLKPEVKDFTKAMKKLRKNAIDVDDDDED